MTYSPPARSTLRAAVARDLRDPEFRTFTTIEVDDLLNLAIVEVSRVYPKQVVQDFPVSIDGQHQWPCNASGIFRVELIERDKYPVGIPNNTSEHSGQTGWDLHAGALWLPYNIATSLRAGTHVIRLWGYWPRETLSSDGEALDGDAEMEFAVRTVAALNGYQRLQNDRLLFQQWLTNTGNTDVSPNQLAQTADLYQSQWREMRMRLRTLQRV
jgi:hypothetical protein